jgi:hypothetical protein
MQKAVAEAKPTVTIEYPVLASFVYVPWQCFAFADERSQVPLVYPEQWCHAF